MLMLILLPVIGVCVAYAAWLLLRRALQAWEHYQHRLHAETQRTLDAAFLFLDVRQLRPAVLGVGAVFLLLCAWLLGRWWGVLPLLCGMLLAPSVALRLLRRRREQLFDTQLPDLMQALAGALRAGAGLQAALQHLVAQSRPPLAQEFALMLREQRLGLGFHAALQQLRQRMPTESCGLVVSALGIAAQTGGSLADTLENIAQTLRTRQHWLGRVRALTAQGRMQSHLMAGLPLLLLLVLSRLEPQAMALLWQTWYGWLVLCGIVLLEGAGIFWIRRVAAIQV
ncbi:type II secretion system F family protein [Castellaniella caeni]|uniref:type II secretion system F family protein n=1 Tax=Castellaniella caeni TaxID=266123 RepID=UPI00082B008D|nr:type II secretion system F family protein [Castellaniella caeni]